MGIDDEETALFWWYVSLPQYQAPDQLIAIDILGTLTLNLWEGQMYWKNQKFPESSKPDVRIRGAD